MFDAKGRTIHYLRLSVTDLCNLRCRYCMPDGVEKLEREDILTYEEFLRLAALFAQCGVDTVRVTGGEPLVRKGVDHLVAQLKAIPGIRRVTMTTNGVLLAQQLPALLAAGLDSVNISLDTLSPEVFARITARDAFADVMAGIRAALESGLPVKLNCVPQVGVNEGELEALAALAETKFLQVRFIEMMPIGYGAAMPCISGPDLLARFRKRWPELALLSRQETAGIGDGPAVYYTAPGWQGSVGFIAAVHGKFCASCNRVRLTSQGFLRPCLASEAGCDLKTLLRSGASDEELLSHVWMNIIQNAIKFSPENAVIEVRVFATDTATVEITDHGIGMDDATVKRIFDRFYQADRSRKQEGVGLGLCLVKRILDMLGGTVSVDSRPGEGSTFRVHVPFRPKYDEAAHTDEREGKSP